MNGSDSHLSVDTHRCRASQVGKDTRKMRAIVMSSKNFSTMWDNNTVKQATSVPITIRVVAPRFVAALVLREDHVVQCAPILRHMMGWSLARVKTYCYSQHWTFEVSPENV